LNFSAALAQTPTPSPTPTPTPAPLRVTKDMLRQAEKLIGLELSDAEEAMANVSTNLDRYEALRKIEVPLDTEPATLFHPALPGRKFSVKPLKFKLSKVEAPKFSSLDDL